MSILIKKIIFYKKLEITIELIILKSLVTSNLVIYFPELKTHKMYHSHYNPKIPAQKSPKNIKHIP